MRLHFSIGCYDYRRTKRLRQSIHFSITQVLFADHVHEARRLENGSDSVVKVGCAMSAISWRFPRCGHSQTRLLCPFSESLAGRVRGDAWPFRFQDRLRKLRLWGLRFHVRFAVGCELVGCTQRVAALPCQWRSSWHGTAVVGGVANKCCSSVR